MTTVRSALLRDAAEIADIYNHYVMESVATFETEPLGADQMARRIDATFSALLPWLLAESDDRIIGYAYASSWKDRQAYQNSVETTVYLDVQHTQQGTGFKLYSALIEAIRETSVHTALGGIALPNEASIRLHEKLGFRKVGHLEEIGYKFDRWVDVGYWQLIL